jgi:predicted amidohydrolase YtcJ
MTNSLPRLKIKYGTLIDGSGRSPIANSLIVVDGNRISHVGHTEAVRPMSPADRTIDATGKFILPGLIDAHCHISLHQGALPGVRYTSSAEFCVLWAAHARPSCPVGGNRRASRWEVRAQHSCVRLRGAVADLKSAIFGSCASAIG